MAAECCTHWPCQIATWMFPDSDLQDCHKSKRVFSSSVLFVMKKESFEFSARIWSKANLLHNNHKWWVPVWPVWFAEISTAVSCQQSAHLVTDEIWKPRRTRKDWKNFQNAKSQIWNWLGMYPRNLYFFLSKSGATWTMWWASTFHRSCKEWSQRTVELLAVQAVKWGNSFHKLRLQNVKLALEIYSGCRWRQSDVFGPKSKSEEFMKFEMKELALFLLHARCVWHTVLP